MALDKNTEAVEALHKTMVMLREELSKKNQKIRYLESRLNHDLEAIHIDGEEPKEEFRTEKNSVKEIIDESNGVSEDPVLEFVLSDEEDEDQNEDQNNSMNVSDVKIHTLVVQQDIDVHPPPRHLTIEPNCGGLMTFSDVRPILRLPSHSPRSSTGSQTDITALNYQNTGKMPFA